MAKSDVSASTNVTSAVYPERTDFPTACHPDSGISPMAMALLELEETAGESLYATLEEMGMVLSGRLRDEGSVARSERQWRRQQAVLALVQRLRDRDGGLSLFAHAAEIPSDEQDKIRRIFSAAQGLMSRTQARKKRAALQAELTASMDEEGWEVTLFGLLELGSADKAVLAPIHRLFQQAMDEEEISLAEWFRRMVDWPDRRRRVRVLLRMAAFELSACVAGAQQTRLAVVLLRLRRLLLFLGLEHECRRLELLCQLPAHSLLSLLIDMTAERWIFEDWLASRLTRLVSSPAMFNRLLQHLDALFALLPDGCFTDDDQREQILTTVRQMKGLRYCLDF